MTQNDTVVLVGHSAVLSCSESKVTWTHFSLSGGRHRPVYINGNITSDYWHRDFRIANNQIFSERNLLIHVKNVTDVVAGKYVCKHISTIRKKEAEEDVENIISSTQLIVLGEQST